MAALQSSAFTDDPVARDRLQRCADSHAFNIHRGRDPVGVWVSEIQSALINIFGENDLLTGIDPAELNSRTYGPTTAQAVRRFKDTPSLNGTGGKILGPGQAAPDDIVGRQTIAALDAQMAGQNGRLGPPTVIEQDVLVQVIGADPRGPGAGQQTSEGFTGIAPTPDSLAKEINTEAYLKGHRPCVVLNFKGGGGLGNPASDPSVNVLKAVAQVRADAVAAGVTPGKVCVIGFSIGGRGAANACRVLVKAGIKVAYLGLVDAAFDNETDRARLDATGADTGEDFFQTVYHFVRGDFPGFEFHGPVTGLLPHTSFDNRSFYQQEKDKAMLQFFANTLPSRRRAIADAHFEKVHDQADKDGYPLVLFKAKSVLSIP